MREPFDVDMRRADIGAAMRLGKAADPIGGASAGSNQDNGLLGPHGARSDGRAVRED